MYILLIFYVYLKMKNDIWKPKYLLLNAHAKNALIFINYLTVHFTYFIIFTETNKDSDDKTKNNIL